MPCACNTGCTLTSSGHTHCVGCGKYGFGIHLGTTHGCKISVTDSTKICYYNGNINYSTYCSLGLCKIGTARGNNALCI